MQFSILKSTSLDSKVWQVYFGKLSSDQKDLHYLPQYANIYCDTYGYEAYLAVGENKEKIIIQPFILKPINNLPFLVSDQTNMFEAANAYGFGGPLIISPTGDNHVNFVEFENRLSEFLLSKNVVTEFILCHPLLKNHTLVNYFDSLNQEKNVVVVNLNLSKEQITKQFNRGTRSKINHAHNAGVTIDPVELNAKNINIFQKLYYQTMQRNHADSKWNFPQTYFTNCVKYLGQDNVSLLFAYLDDKVIAAYFLIHAYSIAYYHFGASDERFFNTRATSLLMAESILYLKSKGFKNYHLGGGVTANPKDSLLQFKLGFTKTTAPLFSYHRVINQKLYEQLNLAKFKYEQDNHLEIVNPNYFPLYKRR